MYDTPPLFGANHDALLFLIDAAAKSVALLLAAAVACGLLRNTSAATRHLIWTSALGALLVVPVLSQVIPGFAIPPSWTSLSWMRAELWSTNDAAPLAQTAQLNSKGSAEERLGPSSMSKPESIEHRATSGLSVGGLAAATATSIGLLWGAGVALCLLPLVLGAWLTALMQRKYPAVNHDALGASVKELAERLSIRSPQLHIGPTGIMPMVWGLRRGHLLLPADSAQWDFVRLRAVLLHELSHLRRRDPLWMLIGQLARAAYWFNPMAWLAVNRMRVEREQACDDCVLNGDVRPSDYAVALLELVSNRRVPGAGGVTLSMGAPSRIEVRLRSILDANRNRQGVTRPTAISILAATCLAIGALSTARASSGETREVKSPPAVAANDQQRGKQATSPVPTKETTPNFLMLPITTDLQRHLVVFGPGKEAANGKAFVLLNGMSVIAPDGKLDEASLRLNELRKGLEPYRDPDAGIVYFMVYYDSSQPAEGSKELLMWALQGFGRNIGFKNSIVSNSYQGEDYEWTRIIQPASSNTDEGDEAMSGDDRVRAYPVRTRLSRILSGNSDCVIDYLTPFNTASDVPLAPGVKKTIKELTSRMELKERKNLLIRVTSP